MSMRAINGVEELSPVRILHIVSSIDPKAGGVSQAIRTMASGLTEFNIESEIVSLDDPDSEFIRFDNCRIYALGVGKTGWNYNNELSRWLSANFLNYDAVIIHGLWQYPSFVVRKLAVKRKGKSPRILVMPHGMLDPWFQKAKGRKIKALRNWIIWQLTEKQVVNTADALLFTCETERILARDTFRYYQPKNEIVVGLGVTLPPPLRGNMLRELRNAIGLEVDENYLLFLGRIDIKKGVDLLLESYISVKEKGVVLPKLVIAGPGLDTPFGAEMSRLAAENQDIIFPGMLTGDLKWGAFYGCEAFILPSHQENFGIAVAEALACGKPVLISDQVNIWREIKQQEACLVEPPTRDGVTKLLEAWAVISEERRIKMQYSSSACFENHYTVKKVSLNMSTAIRQLLGIRSHGERVV
ncbi:glycosyltransferase [Dyadobacter bucti]|uniref:glycosyltransferase n=1 Tax=Dyadobacter bucti TaxID=2572203 RepID=UPI003F731240